MSLWSDREFGKLLLARLISTAGSAVSNVALPVLMYSLTGSAAYTAALAALTAAPYLVFGLIAGAVVDRMHRRTVMVLTDLASAVFLASVPIAAVSGLLVVYAFRAFAVPENDARIGVLFSALSVGGPPCSCRRSATCGHLG